jgi:hypothetical protein
MAEPRPDQSYIQDVHKHLRDLLLPAHNHWDKVDSYINQTFPVWDALVPGNTNRTKFHPATATAIVRKGAATQLSYEPKVHRERRTGKDGEELQDADKIAGGIENALKEILDDASLNEMLLPYKMLGIYGVAYGYFILGAGLDRTVWPKRPPKGASKEKMDEYEHEKRNANPFKVFAPHPSHVLLPFNTKRPKYAVVTEKWLGDDIEHATRVRADRVKKFKPEVLDIFDADKDRFKELEILELWTPDWHTLMIKEDGHLLFVERNTWGFVPYIHAVAGFSQEFTSSGMTLPEQLATGMLSFVLEGIQIQAQRESALQDWSLRQAYAPLLTSKDPGQLRAAIANGIGGGTGWKKDDVWWLEYPQRVSEMAELGRWVDNDIEGGTFRKDLGGQRQPGVVTVGQQQILSEAAMRDFSALAKQIDFVASGNGAQILRLADILGEDVTVAGKTLHVGHLNKDFQVNITFELIDQIIQMQRTEQLMTAMEKGVVTGAYVREYGLRIEDEAGMKRALARERIENMEVTQLMNDAQTAKEMGKEKLAQLMEDQAKARLDEIEAQLSGEDIGPAEVPGPNGQEPRQPVGPNAVKPPPRRR